MSNHRSTIYIRVQNPFRIFLWSGVVYGVLWLAAPLDFKYSGNYGALFLALSYFVSFGVALLLAFRRVDSPLVKLTVDIASLEQYKRTVAIIGICGLLLKIFDRLFLRAGGGWSYNFYLNRLLVASGGNGALSLSGSIFGALLLLLPFFVVLCRKCRGARFSDLLYFSLSVAYPAFDLMSLGSRSTGAIYLGILFVSMLTIGVTTFTYKKIFVGFAASLAIIWVAGYVFWVRTTQFGGDPIASMRISGYAEFVPVSNWVIQQLRATGVVGLESFLYAYISVSQYLLHGMYEFFLITDKVQGATTDGLQTFYIPVKIYMALSGHSGLESIISRGELRPGVYTTLFGPFVYDYGPLGGLVATSVFGAAVGGMARALRRGRQDWLPLYLVCVGLLPYSFTVNFYVSGTGQALLIGGAVLSMLSKLGWLKFDAIIGGPGAARLPGES